MRAVVYARYSSHRQNEQSIEGQLTVCEQYAERENIQIINTYTDRALSAKTDKRPQFQKMISDSGKGLFDVVLVYKLDRFSRNRYDSATYKAKLKKNGVRVVSSTESISDNPEGIILEGLLESMAEYYSAELSQKVSRGMRENAKKCKSNGAPVAMGYSVDKDKNYIINPQTAPIVVEIYERYASGEKVGKIIENLNQRGVKNSRGGAFGVSSFNTILRNEKYIGTYKFGDVIVPDGIPSIVDKFLFEKVQKRIKQNKRLGGKNKAVVEYILSPKIHCGYCKAPIIGESGYGKNNVVYNYYKCSTRKKGADCEKQTVRKDGTEDVVINAIIDTVFVDETLKKIAKRINNIIVEESKNNPRLTALENEYADAQKRLYNLFAVIEQGIVSSGLQERITQLEDSVCALKKEIEITRFEVPQTNEKELFEVLQGKSYTIPEKNFRYNVILAHYDYEGKSDYELCAKIYYNDRAEYYLNPGHLLTDEILYFDDYALIPITKLYSDKNGQLHESK